MKRRIQARLTPILCLFSITLHTVFVESGSVCSHQLLHHWAEVPNASTTSHCSAKSTTMCLFLRRRLAACCSACSTSESLANRRSATPTFFCESRATSV
eukprot:3714773-Amphidinium_carterae.2